MEVLEAIRGRRSCRRYDPRPVEREKLLAVVEAATWAPSPGNSQPWRFVIIQDAARKKAIRENARLALRYHLYEVSGFQLPALHRFDLRPLDGVGFGSHRPPPVHESYHLDFLERVPVFVAVAADPRATPDWVNEGRDDGHKYAAAAAIQNMLLAAYSLGLGSLWFTLFHERTLKPQLGVAPQLHLVALVCLGYAAGAPPRAHRRQVSDLLRFLGEGEEDGT